MRRGKKLSHIVQSVVLVLVFTMLLGTASMAVGEVSDHPWGKDENGNAHYFQTGVMGFTSNVRVKRDNTSTYIWFQEGSLRVIRAVIMGTGSNKVNTGINCTGADRDRPLSHVSVVKNDAYSNRFFFNSVNENDRTYSYLKLYSSENGTAMGVWSPDSVGP